MNVQHKSIFVDHKKCIKCNACIVACKMEHNLPPYPTSPPVAEPTGANLIRVFQVGPEIREGTLYQYFLAIPCMHCSEPPCIASCPTTAISKCEDGVMQVDGNKCIGCKFCLWVCPYGSPQFTPEGKMVLCDMCIHRIQDGKKAACEAACVARCIYIGTPDEISRITGQRAASRIGRTTSIA